MGDYAFRVLNSVLGSEMLPASIRMKLMRRLGFNIADGSCIWAGASIRSKKIDIGAGVFINIGFYFDGYDRLEIGDNVRIGQFVRVITATHDIGPSEQRGLIEVLGKPVRIEAGCWIGSGVSILPGVTIERGCVIAANAVVMEKTESDGLYAGNPARRVRELH
ncbi:DapH/DapD/GlmU-related protein [Beijerinckia sp. L45]|uniref:acyltransferase n=1 Tax=Beijerinckia sp. L45 TaxID=1641855 RepID=UPI00131C4434|nr:acyltransferase [Beijerinckia sp. L45]